MFKYLLLFFAILSCAISFAQLSGWECDDFSDETKVQILNDNTNCISFELEPHRDSDSQKLSLFTETSKNCNSQSEITLRLKDQNKNAYIDISNNRIIQIDGVPTGSNIYIEYNITSTSPNGKIIKSYTSAWYMRKHHSTLVEKKFREDTYGINQSTKQRELIDFEHISHISISYEVEDTQTAAGLNGHFQINSIKLGEPDANSVISGTGYIDDNDNCAKDINETFLATGYINIQPVNYTKKINTNGAYTCKLKKGVYTVNYYNTKEALKNNITSCTKTVTLDEYDTAFVDMGVQFPSYPLLDIEIAPTRRRRCFPSTTTINFENYGAVAANETEIKIDYPEHVVPKSANPMWTKKEGKSLYFLIDEIAAFSKDKITIQDSVICWNEDIRDLTQCVDAYIYPNNKHILPEDYDGSNITITTDCDENDEAHISLVNAGSNMETTSEMRLFIDAKLAQTTPFSLAPKDTLQMDLFPNGKTIRVEADQENEHPVFTVSTKTIEACGTDDNEEVSKGYVNQLPSYDDSPIYDQSCSPIVDSYDPNDKQVFPKGVANEGFILPNTDLEYLIRFQNTGSDTAYKVVVVDTISPLLDLYSITVNNSSHAYTWNIDDSSRAITWTFNNINLVDSTTNEKESHGFVSFKIAQNSNLENASIIQNKAEIYFDYNSEIVTNLTSNMVMDPIPVFEGDLTAHKILLSSNTSFKDQVQTNYLFPNPSTGEIKISNDYQSIKIYNAQGQMIRQSNKEKSIMIENPGIYYYTIQLNNGSLIQDQFVIIQ